MEDIDKINHQLKKSHFDKIIKGIEKVRSVKFNYIPFSPVINRIREDFPGVIKRNYVIVTAGSGVGKSKFTNYFYVMEPLLHLLNNPYEIYPLIDVYPLEEGRDKFYHSFICNLLYERFGIVIKNRELKGIPNTNALTDELLDKIRELRDFFDLFEKHVRINTNIECPKEIHLNSVKRIKEYGTLLELTEQGEKVKVFKPKDEFSNIHFIKITDHIGLVDSEKYTDLKRAIGEHSKYCMKQRDIYDMSVIDVQQQSAEGEALQFTSSGKQVERKLEPSKANLAENKQTYNNADEVIGIFAPDRYDITEYRRHNIEILGDNYRYMKFLKSRDGAEGVGIGLGFNGAASSYKEIPDGADLTDEEWRRYVVEHFPRSNDEQYIPDAWNL